jgi:hypothetical protein
MCGRRRCAEPGIACDAQGRAEHCGTDKSIWLSRLIAATGLIGITLFLASGDSIRKRYDAASQILNLVKDRRNDKRLGASEKGSGEKSSVKESSGTQEGGREAKILIP